MFKYQRSTNKERKFPHEKEEIQPDGSVKIVRYEEPTVLTGFGKYELVDFIGSPDFVNEAFIKGWPPHYRRQSICTPEELELFREFTSWLIALTVERDNNGSRSRTQT